jgi:hypothetical protein
MLRSVDRNSISSQVYIFFNTAFAIADAGMTIIALNHANRSAKISPDSCRWPHLGQQHSTVSRPDLVYLKADFVDRVPKTTHLDRDPASPANQLLRSKVYEIVEVRSRGRARDYVLAPFAMEDFPMIAENTDASSLHYRSSHSLPDAAVSWIATGCRAVDDRPTSLRRAKRVGYNRGGDAGDRSDLSLRDDVHSRLCPHAAMFPSTRWREVSGEGRVLGAIAGTVSDGPRPTRNHRSNSRASAARC